MGNELLTDKDRNSLFIKDYKISGIPRFILIDPDGNIVSSDVLRPSHKDELIELFEERGIKK